MGCKYNGKTDNACARGKLEACRVSVQKNVRVGKGQIWGEAVGKNFGSGTELIV